MITLWVCCYTNRKIKQVSAVTKTLNTIVTMFFFSAHFVATPHTFCITFLVWRVIGVMTVPVSYQNIT
jgi:hypothetical protein